MTSEENIEKRRRKDENLVQRSTFRRMLKKRGSLLKSMGLIGNNSITKSQIKGNFMF